MYSLQEYIEGLCYWAAVPKLVAIHNKIVHGSSYHDRAHLALTDAPVDTVSAVTGNVVLAMVKYSTNGEFYRQGESYPISAPLHKAAKIELSLVTDDTVNLFAVILPYYEYLFGSGSWIVPWIIDFILHGNCHHQLYLKFSHPGSVLCLDWFACVRLSSKRSGESHCL